MELDSGGRDVAMPSEPVADLAAHVVIGWRPEWP
jgi:hypothetical protein